MATLIGDLYGADPSPFHHVRAASTHQQHQQHPVAQHQLQHDPATQSQPPSQSQSHSAIPPRAPSHPASPPLSSSNSFTSPPLQQSLPASRPASDKPVPTVSDGSDRIPTPPESSTPTSPQLQHHQHHHQPVFLSSSAASAASTATASTSPLRNAPAPSRVTMASNACTASASIATPVIAIPVQDEPRLQMTIMVRDLAHIQALTQPDHSYAHSIPLRGGILAGTAPLQDIKFDISAMPIGDIIEMVAALLTKITTTNDHQHDVLHRNTTHSRQTQAHSDHEPNASTSPHSSHSSHSPHSASVLAFHGKNVPAITILSYLSRIHKYCPTTYEVFLSLLVYFDRMTDRVNDLVEKQQRIPPPASVSTAPTAPTAPLVPRSPDPASTEDMVMGDSRDTATSYDGATVIVEMDDNIVDSSSDSSFDDADDPDSQGAATTRSVAPNAQTHVSTPRTASPHVLSATYFVVDSYNIHRLIIAGVTCSSKFFSDVFYTNARYAKVGGLPLAELNHLELQFLILNDFRLAIPIEDLDAYATMLVEFYAREVVEQRPRGAA